MQNPGSKDQIWKWGRVGGGREGEREGGERNRRGRGKIDKIRKEREERRVWTDWSNMAVHYTPRKI